MISKHNEQLNWDRLVKSQVAIWEVKQQIKQHSLSHPQEGFFKDAVITISRTHGAGGDEVAREISNILNWQIYDRELVEYIARSGQVRQNIVQDLDERVQSETHNYMLTVLSRNSMGFDKYFKLLHDVIVTIANEGQAIIIGRGSNFIVDPQKSIRVMITAPLSYRIERIAREQNLSEKEARKTVSLVDSNRFAFVHRYYHRNANDHTAYDLVLNAEHMEPQITARIIINALSTKVSVLQKKHVEMEAAQ